MLKKVEICGVDTSKIHVLSYKETKELFLKMKAGESKAREALISGNLKLVLSIVQKFSGRGENPDDLFQVGCVGLIKAIDNFNVDLNLRLATYAVPMIIGEIRRYLRDNNSIRVSRSMRDIAYKALTVRNKIAGIKNEEPTVEEIAKEMNTPCAEVVFALDAIQDPVSLYEPMYHDGGDAVFVVDKVADEKNADDVWLENIALRDAVGRLGQREQQIVKLRFFKGKTQMEVSGELGISQAQVSRLEKAAIKNIRKFYN